MRKSVQTALILAIGIVFVVMLIAGCEEQSLSNTKKSRLIANENRQLKQQLARRDREIEKQKGLLAKCLVEKKNLLGLSDEKIENMMGGAFGNISKQNVELQQENKKLKAQIEELKNQLKDKE
ncbi:MAG: hypothetical protein ACYS1A_10000 [Planctomycetota bacterium]|jgi:cell division protein FtsB